MILSRCWRALSRSFLAPPRSRQVSPRCPAGLASLLGSQRSSIEHTRLRLPAAVVARPFQALSPAMGRTTRATAAVTRPTADGAPLTAQAAPATPRRRRADSRTAAATPSDPAAEVPPTSRAPARKRSKRQASTTAAAGASAVVAAETAWPEPSEAVLVGDDAAAEEAEPAAEPPKKRGGRRKLEPPPLTDLPTPEYVAALRAQGYQPPPLPVPNLGYACLNTVMRACKPPIFTSRDCIKRTLDAKGLPFLGELSLQNCKDLALLIQWNAEHGIRFFRMSSVLFPWMGTFEVRDLPQYEEIRTALRHAGDLARLHGQRLTFHPSHFVKLASLDEQLTQKSLKELEAHSQIMDLLGYEPSPVNKINIHVGGVYSAHGSKQETMDRWAANFRKLSPACQARMTVENDDVKSAFSLEDLLYLHSLTGCPLVYDFHHHKFCPGSLSDRQALEAAMRTWPPGVRPVVHWSESQEGRKPHAHSDYVRGPINLHGHDAEVDVMIEAKAKEQALLAYRGDIPFPETLTTADEVPVDEEAEVALRLL